jgi:hypothetical protein
VKPAEKAVGLDPAMETKAATERMPTFVKSVIVEAPVEIVFGFHERDDACGS